MKNKKKYVPMKLTVLGEVSSQTLGGSDYFNNDGRSGMGMAIDQGNDQNVVN